MEQTTLFDEIEREGQHRRRHNRVCHKRGDYTAYYHFLIQYKLNLINGKRVSIFKLQSQFNICRFKVALMPDDIDTIAIEDITYEYACKWYKDKIDPYLRASRIKSKNKELANATPQPVADATPSLADVLAEIESATHSFITEMENKINTFKTLLTTKTTSL